MAEISSQQRQTLEVRGHSSHENNNRTGRKPQASNNSHASRYSSIVAEEFSQPEMKPELSTYIDTLLIQWLTLPGTKALLSDILTGRYTLPDVGKVSEARKLNKSNQKNSSSDTNNDIVVKKSDPRKLKLKDCIKTEKDSPLSPAKCPSPRSAKIVSRQNQSPRNQSTPVPVQNSVQTRSSSLTPSYGHRESISESFKGKRLKTPEIIPKFYFPFGKTNGDERTVSVNSIQSKLNILDIHSPTRPKTPTTPSISDQLKKLQSAFASLPGGRIARLHDMEKITSSCSCPIYWRRALFNAVGGHRAGQITADHFIKFWEHIIKNYHDEPSRFIAVVSTQRRNNENSSRKAEKLGLNKHNHSLIHSHKDHFLEFNDFMPIIQDVVDSHPGLNFLLQAPEFHSRYIQTVICRIFYHINRSWSGKITISEMRGKNGTRFLNDLKLLSELDEINHFTWYFSYEHFYVIYCKFWELDKDHDLIISSADLLEYQNGALTNKIVERLMSGSVTRYAGSDIKKKTMGYRDFVYFILAENDKFHPTAIEYWFRVLDLDGDGILSLYELEYFYEEQAEKLQSLDVEPLNFEDVICLAIDSVNCHNNSTRIKLSDLKKSKLVGTFLDTFINTMKYLDNENEDSGASDEEEGVKVENKSEIAAWEKYCCEEYALLSIQEQQQHDEANDNIEYKTY